MPSASAKSDFVMRIRGHLPTVVMAFAIVGVSVAVFFSHGVAGIGVVGSFASLVSLVVSVYIAISVNLLRRRYVRHIMFKECHQRLVILNKAIQGQLTKKNFDSVKTQLGRAKAILDRVDVHDPDGNWAASSVDVAIGANEADLADSVRACLPSIGERIEKLELLAKELDWGRGDE